MNNKAQMFPIIVLIGGIIMLVLLVAGMTIGLGVIKTGTDIIFPEISKFGEVTDGVNISESANYVLNPVSTIISNLGLIMGIIYLLGIAGLLTIAFVFRGNQNGWVIAIFVASILLLIITCIAISEFYETFYLAQNDYGGVLRDYSLVSFLIIYSPTIMTIVAFIAGVILFTGNQEGRFV